MRLIDADKLRDRFEAMRSLGVRLRYSGVKGMIDTAPTVDPAQRGGWINLSNDNDPHFLCSSCGGSLDVEYVDLKYSYCPSCGVRMDGGNKK